MPAPPTIMLTNDRISHSRTLQESSLYRLVAWLSPGFPVGAFSFSHGLETAVESGTVRDRASMQHWICAVVASGSGRIGSHILRDAYCAAMAGDIEALTFVNRRGLAFRATRGDGG
jgi:urease accessory protein